MKEFLIPFWGGPTFEHFDATFTKIGSQSEYVKICSEIFCKIHRKAIVESFRPSTLLKRESLKILKNFQNNYFVDHLQTAAFLSYEITPNSVIFQITETWTQSKTQQNTRHNLYGYEKKIFDNLLEQNLIENFKSAWIIRSIRQLYRENYMGWNIRSFPFLTTHWPSISQVYLNK